MDELFMRKVYIHLCTILLTSLPFQSQSTFLYTNILAEKKKKHNTLAQTEAKIHSRNERCKDMVL